MEIEKIGKLIREEVKKIGEMPEETVTDIKYKLHRLIVLQKVVEGAMLNGNIDKSVYNMRLIKQLWDEMKGEASGEARKVLDDIRGG